MRSKSDLRPAQLALIDEMVSFPGGIAVLGMGGGKTASALFAQLTRKQTNPAIRAIVFAPARVVENAWPKEVNKWEELSELDVVAVTGTPTKRKKILAEDHDVYVVSIENTQWLVDQIKDGVLPHDLDNVTLYIDEISRYRNPRSKRAQALFKIVHKFEGVWGLTGTPRPNGYEDLWMPIRLVSADRAVWGVLETTDRKGNLRPAYDFDTWRNRHFYPMDKGGFKWKPHAFCEPDLQAVANEWLVTAPVADLDTPPLNTGPDFTKWVDMGPDQHEAYEEMFNELVASGRSQGMSGDDLIDWVVEAVSRGVASGKLTQIVQGFLYREGDAEAVHFKNNPKLDMLMEMDQDLGDDRAIICYGLREEIALLRKALGKHRTLALIGGGVSNKVANQAIEDWIAGKIDRLLIHPASAGHGVDGLQLGGHHMIWYHPTWSSEQLDQTIKRIDRPGQTHEVFNWTIAMRDTNDEIKLARAANKIEDERQFKEKLRCLIA